jgi:hypothetical protein
MVPNKCFLNKKNQSTTIKIITTITIKAITTCLTAILKPVYTGLVFFLKKVITVMPLLAKNF